MAFDANKFIQASTAAAMDTVIIPVPEGEYMAVAEKLEASQNPSKDGTRTVTSLNVTWIVEDEDVRVALNRAAGDKVTVRQSIFLDLTPDGELDCGAGKNIGLGLLRTALNKNEAGVVFSLEDIVGNAVKVRVKHRVVQKEGEEQATVYAEVRAVSRL